MLHLLDKPEAAWEDPAMDRIYEDLRAEFDLAARYEALEAKLQTIQEALVLALDVARDRRTPAGNRSGVANPGGSSTCDPAVPQVHAVTRYQLNSH